MKWLEVIRVRSLGEKSRLLEGLLDQTASSAGTPGLLDMRVYVHGSVESDVSLHLHWESDQPERNGSALGRQLSGALEEFGLVDHAVWTEERGRE